MRSSTLLRTAGFVASAGLTVALIGAAAASTGAYFTDTKSGVISGTTSTIKITGYDGGGDDKLDMTFANLLPGQPQDKTVRFQNTGNSNQDVWVLFNPTDLGTGDAKTGINSLGRYGSVHIKTGGTSVFDSDNLNDAYPCGTPGLPGFPTLCAVPGQIKLAGDVAPGTVGDFTFSFTAGARFKNNAQNIPVLKLGYKLVATQVGIAPNAENSDPITWP